MILVTGAAGTVGSAVVEALVNLKTVGVRAMYRGEKDRHKIPAGIEPVQGDFADPASLAKALAGVSAAYLVCSPVPNLVELETNFLQAAAEAKISHLVINSALGAEDFPKTFPSWHRKVEDKARAMNLPITILRPNGFMQNIASYFLPTIVSQDAFYGTIGDAKISLIDVRDVGAAAAKALTSPSTLGKVFELSGPEAINYQTLAAKVSRVAGRDVKFVNLTPEQMLGGMTSAGMPENAAKSVLELDDYYRLGKGAASDAALRQLIDREPRTIDQYLAEIATRFTKA